MQSDSENKATGIPEFIEIIGLLKRLPIADRTSILRKLPPEGNIANEYEPMNAEQATKLILKKLSHGRLPPFKPFTMSIRGDHIELYSPGRSSDMGIVFFRTGIDEYLEHVWHQFND